MTNLYLKYLKGKRSTRDCNVNGTSSSTHSDTLGGLKVIAVEDYQSQKRINKRDDKIETISLPKSNVIRLIFDEGFVALRPSGTEPKLKFYLSLNVDDFEQVSHDIYQYIFNDNK